MIDLIDRKLLLNSRVYSTRSGKPNYENIFKNLVNDILTAPTVDTERHAHWIENKEFGVHCSNCGRKEVIRYDYCRCGCKMDEVEE